MAEENPPRSVPAAGKESIDRAVAGDRHAVMPPPSRGHAVQDAARNIVILIAVVVLIVGGVFLWRYLSSYESTDDAQVDVHLYPVSARVSGYVIQVNVNDNQWVQKGTVLVEIDPKDYEVAVAQAQANLASAEATAQSLNITVPITSVNTSSQLKFTASGRRRRQRRNHRRREAAHRRSCPSGSGRGQRCEGARRSPPLQGAGRQAGSGRRRSTIRRWPRPNPARHR